MAVLATFLLKCQAAQCQAMAVKQSQLEVGAVNVLSSVSAKNHLLVARMRGMSRKDVWVRILLSVLLVVYNICMFVPIQIVVGQMKKLRMYCAAYVIIKGVTGIFRSLFCSLLISLSLMTVVS